VVRPLILETTFLVDLERDHLRGSGPTLQFLERNAEALLYLPLVVAGELASGASPSDRRRWDAFLAPFYLLPMTREIAWEYGRTYRHLQRAGQLIGANDLWTAATALVHQMPVVTRDVERFRRVPHLDVETY